MEQKFNTSFIPKKSLQADVDGSSSEKYARRHSSQSPGFYVALLIFIAALVTSFGLFGYTTIIENTVQKKINTLKDQKNLFTEANIEILIAEEKRINLAKELVTSHVAVSELFSEIERITLKQIQYIGMEYHDEPDADPLFVLSGIAKDYQDVAMQTTQYRESAPILSPIVKELGTEDTGLVYFSIENLTDPNLIAFTNAIENEKNRAESPVTETPTTPATTGSSTETSDGSEVDNQTQQ